MKMQTVGDQGNTHHHQKAESEHFEGLVFLDKGADGFGSKDHDQHSDHIRGDHDPQNIGQADSSDHGVEREDDIKDRNLQDGGRKGQVFNFFFIFLDPGDGGMDFCRGFIEEEEPAREQNDVAPRDVEGADGQDGLFQLDDPGDAGEENNPSGQRHGEADFSGARLL